MTEDNCHRNYPAKGSEFVEDICTALRNSFDWASDCYEQYLEETTGAIVTFKIDAEDDEDLDTHIQEAIEYVWRCHFDLGETIWSTHYDSKGATIPAECIIDLTIV